MFITWPCAGIFAQIELISIETPTTHFDMDEILPIKLENGKNLKHILEIGPNIINILYFLWFLFTANQFHMRDHKPDNEKLELNKYKFCHL